jgi:endonuclease III
LDFQGTWVLKVSNIKTIFARFQAALPEPKGELEHVNAYTLLVAVVLSAQMTDVGVNKATRALFSVADTPQKMLDLGIEKLKDYIKTINFYPTKAKNVLLLSERLVTDFQGEIPSTLEALQSLAGVGRKTANVVLNMAFGEPTLAVDTHVFRTARRLGLANGETPLAVELELLAIIPEPYRLHAHHWLILHGRYTCKARKPLCGACVVADLCPSRQV